MGKLDGKARGGNCATKLTRLRMAASSRKRVHARHEVGRVHSTARAPVPSARRTPSM